MPDLGQEPGAIPGLVEMKADNSPEWEYQEKNPTWSPKKKDKWKEGSANGDCNSVVNVKFKVGNLGPKVPMPNWFPRGKTEF